MEEQEGQIEMKQKLMQDEQAKLEGKIKHLNNELKKLKGDESGALQVVHAEKESLEDVCSTLDDKYKEKDAVLEKALAHRADLEKQLTKLKEEYGNSVQQMSRERDRLHSECSEMYQRLHETNSNLKALADESLAKTQQVKQYKKQVDNFRAQLQESNARIKEYKAKLEQYHHDLTYYQKDLQARVEDEESKVT